MTPPAWRATYSQRFLARAIQRPPRPTPPRPYVRATDEQIEAMAEVFRPIALFVRSFHDVAASLYPAPQRADDQGST